MEQKYKLRKRKKKQIETKDNIRKQIIKED